MDNCVRTKSSKAIVVSHGQMADFYKVLLLILQVIMPCKKLVVWPHETEGIISTSTLICQLYHFMDLYQSTSLTCQPVAVIISPAPLMILPIGFCLFNYIGV